MFNTTHILYMVISAILSVALFVVLSIKVKRLTTKELILKISAISTVAIHFSSLWVDFLKNGEATIESNMLFPIHPCNICMWLLLIVAFYKKREGIVYKTISEFTFWAGTVCGSIGILLNENFASNPTLADYDVLKGLLSHSTMIFGCIYLLVGGFIKIRATNTISVAIGLCGFVVDGAIINALYSIFDLPPCNSMYLQEVPFAQMPWLNTVVIGVIAVLVTFLISALHEIINLPIEERWYSIIKSKATTKEKKS